MVKFRPKISRESSLGDEQVCDASSGHARGLGAAEKAVGKVMAKGAVDREPDPSIAGPGSRMAVISTERKSHGRMHC